MKGEERHFYTVPNEIKAIEVKVRAYFEFLCVYPEDKPGQ
jgi:hypothetical protein